MLAVVARALFLATDIFFLLSLLLFRFYRKVYIQFFRKISFQTYFLCVYQDAHQRIFRIHYLSFASKV